MKKSALIKSVRTFLCSKNIVVFLHAELRERFSWTWKRFTCR